MTRRSITQVTTVTLIPQASRVAPRASEEVTSAQDTHGRTQVSGQPQVQTLLHQPSPPNLSLLTRTSGQPAVDTALRRPHHRGPAWLGPLLPPLTLCRKVPGAPFPGCHAEHPGHSRGSRAPQQHTLFPAREARQPLAHGLPTGPSLEPDTGASLGQRREDRDHRGRLALSRGPHASQVCRPPGTCSARGGRCPSTATSSADGGCHPGASPAAREWTQLLDEALTLRDESARWNRVLPRADSCLWKLRQPSSLASWNARKRRQSKERPADSVLGAPRGP